MDAVYFYFDISVLAVGLSVVGFFIGHIINRSVYAPTSLIGALLALYSGRTVFGAPIDITTLVAYLLSFLSVGIAVGNYIGMMHRTMKLLLQEIYVVKQMVEQRERKQ